MNFFNWFLGFNIDESNIRWHKSSSWLFIQWNQQYLFIMKWESFMESTLESFAFSFDTWSACLILNQIKYRIYLEELFLVDFFFVSLFSSRCNFFVSKEVLWMKCKYSCRLCFLPRWYYNNLRVTGCFCKSRISLMEKFLLTNFHNHCGFCWMTQSVYWIDIKGENYIRT